MNRSLRALGIFFVLLSVGTSLTGCQSDSSASSSATPPAGSPPGSVAAPTGATAAPAASPTLRSMQKERAEGRRDR